MILANKIYRYATEDHVDRIAIPEIDRNGYMTQQYIDMFEDELNSIKLDGTIGIVYSCGASMHQAETRMCYKRYSNSLEILPSPMVIKSTVAYMAHKYAGLFEKNGNKVVDVDIVSNTCASSMYALKRAEQMLLSCDNVIVITEEKTSFDTIRIFNEHNIDVKPSDGFAVCVFTNSGSGVMVSNVKTAFSYSANPFMTTAEGYRKVYSECDIVKLHGTGTDVNSIAEKEVFDRIKTIEYKSKIGHCQGSSGLVELCMAIDDVSISGRILCVSSGLGGYYASCTIQN